MHPLTCHLSHLSHLSLTSPTSPTSLAAVRVPRPQPRCRQGARLPRAAPPHGQTAVLAAGAMAGRRGLWSTDGIASRGVRLPALTVLLRLLRLTIQVRRRHLRLVVLLGVGRARGALRRLREQRHRPRVVRAGVVLRLRFGLPRRAADRLLRQPHPRGGRAVVLVRAVRQRRLLHERRGAGELRLTVQRRRRDRRRRRGVLRGGPARPAVRGVHRARLLLRRGRAPLRGVPRVVERRAARAVRSYPARRCPSSW